MGGKGSPGLAFVLFDEIGQGWTFNLFLLQKMAESAFLQKTDKVFPFMPDLKQSSKCDESKNFPG